MSAFQFTHTDTTDDVHTYNVVADTLTAAKRDVAATLGATYGPVKLAGNKGEYVVTATHGRQTFGTVTVERIEDTEAREVPAPLAMLRAVTARNVAAGNVIEAIERIENAAPAPVVYTVAYNDERGNSAERTFTNRADAVILFHETAGIDYAGFPADDAEAFEHIGWATETQELRGVTHIAEYTPERGNWNVTLYITVEHAPEDISAPTFPWPTAPMGGDYTGGRPLPELGDVVMTHRWRGGVRDIEASPATVVEGITSPDARVVRFADGKEQAAFGYDMEPTGARVVEIDGRTFEVTVQPDGWYLVTERGGNRASGTVEANGPRWDYTVDESGAQGWANTRYGAVREFAAETRMVHATRAQRNVAAGYASPGTIGRVLAELATTGTARIDLLADDVRRTIGSLAMPERPAAAVELHAILTDVR